MKIKERLGNCSRLKKKKPKETNNVAHDSALNHLALRNNIRKLEKFEMGLGIRW